MDYASVIDYLYHAAPMFSNIGAGAYKEGLATTRALDEHFGHPHRRFRTIHVAGTNGKGSVSSTLAAVLQSAGLRVGLYTSPHLVDSRERIRVDGEMIPQQRVIDFVENERAFFEPLQPSFFELTTALAFLYFAEQKVDVAVVEVGLGGRLDCTNIISPDLCVITNISFDHQQFLGDTLPQIAAEKAGIMKAGVPVVIGETNSHSDVRDVFVSTFESLADASSADAVAPDAALTPVIRFADEEHFPPIDFELKGDYQRANQATVQCALDELRRQPFYAERITDEAISDGFAHVMELTGLRGRWQQLQTEPTVVCDAGHNAAGITFVSGQLQREVARLREQGSGCLRLVFGMVGDKDYLGAAAMLSRLDPKLTRFYITQPSCARALPAAELASAFRNSGASDLREFTSVDAAVNAALADAAPSDFIFVGGSCYVVADLLGSCFVEK